MLGYYILATRVNGVGSSKRYLIPGYGHIDCIFGKNAAKDVYPIIGNRLDETNRRSYHTFNRRQLPPTSLLACLKKVGLFSTSRVVIPQMASVENLAASKANATVKFMKTIIKK